MNNRGEFGCALLLVAAVVAGGIFLVIKAPWLLLAGPAAFVLCVIALIALADVFNDNVLVASDEPGGFTARRVALVNRLRRALNKPPLLQTPRARVTYEERQMVKQASQLTEQIMKTLPGSPVPESERAPLRQQAAEVPQNMARALWRLSRLRRVRNSLDLRTPEGKANRDEMDGLDRQMVAELQRALATLSGTPVNLMKLELAQADRPAQRLLGDLNEANSQLRDLASAYEELRGTRDAHGAQGSSV